MLNRNANEKKKSFDFYYTELSAIAEYLEQQEKEGYRLVRFENGKLVFEKCEPRNIRYSVEIFNGSSYREFIESCTLEGWEHVTTYNGELYIFRTQKSDAIDIMTDKKEKFKIIAKKAIFQPGVWRFLFFTLYPLYRIILRRNIGSSIKLFETDVMNYMSLMFCILYCFMTLLRLFDCFLWQYKIRNEASDSPYFTLKNTIHKRNIYAGIICSAFVILNLILWWIAPNFYSSVLIIIFATFFLFAIYYGETITKLNFNEKKSVKKIVTTCIIIGIITGGAFLLKNCNERYIIENTKEMLSLEKAPISAEVLFDSAKSCEDTCSVEGTRFGQIYTYTSDAEIYEEKNLQSRYVSYNIFVSDYPKVRQKYIDEILENYDEYDYEKIVSPDTKWDYYYIVKLNDENVYKGFAVKDNIIIYLRYSIHCKQNFFDIAYEELFGE